MTRIHLAGGLTAVAVVCAFATEAAAQGPPPPPPPTADNGATVHTLAHGIPIPTSFAFGHGTVFVGANGSEDGKQAGGVWAIGSGTAARVHGSPRSVMGVAWRSGKLYVAGGRDVTAYRGWNGKRFAHRTVVYRAPKRFSGFNGIAFGPDGKLYAGVTLLMADDHRKSHRPFAQSVISMRRDGSHVRTVARGLRQPYQLAFVKGMRHPFVTVLGQDAPPGVNPPDYIVHVRRGQDYGFPKCTHMTRKPCRGFAAPWRLLPPHTSPMGIAAIGKTLYVALFGGIGKSGPEVVSMSARHRHGRITPVLHGFVAPIVGLGAHHGSVYVGDLTGSVYRVRP